jgi:hypothetical protein
VIPSAFGREGGRTPLWDPFHRTYKNIMGPSGTFVKKI